MDSHTDCYVAALGHMPQDRRISNVMQVSAAHTRDRGCCTLVYLLALPASRRRHSTALGTLCVPHTPRLLQPRGSSAARLAAPGHLFPLYPAPSIGFSRAALVQVKVILDLARAMLAVVDELPYPDTLGKMQVRIGVHVGAVYGGVIGVKYPRYSLFGSTLRLAQGLQVRGCLTTLLFGPSLQNPRPRRGSSSALLQPVHARAHSMASVMLGSGLWGRRAVRSVAAPMTVIPSLDCARSTATPPARRT